MKEKQEQKTEISKTKAKSRTEPAIKHELNNIVVEQRVTDGFINGTAMCVAHEKRIVDWFRNQETHNLIEALAKDLGLKIKGENSHLSSAISLSATYPDLVVSKRGSPENGGGVWLHPDLAIQLAQWCNPFFAIQVSRWVREWIIASEEQRRRQKIIAACISDIALPWEKRFDDDFIQDLQRVSGRSRTAAYLLLRYFYNQFSSDVYKPIIEAIHQLPIKVCRDSPGTNNYRIFPATTRVIDSCVPRQTKGDRCISVSCPPVAALVARCRCDFRNTIFYSHDSMIG